MIWAHIKWWYRCWVLGHAKQFARDLERTIARERVRSKHDLEEAETLERRAYMEIVKLNANKKRKALA